jgi:hypothetical protein
MANCIGNISRKEGKELFAEPSELSLELAQMLREAENTGLSYREIIDIFMCGSQSAKVYAVAKDFETTHAYLLVGARIKALSGVRDV